MVVFIGLVIVTVFCAFMTVRAVRLFHAALWLAGVSLTVALTLYLIGATMMAVIELSLSVGLVTIMLVFAISMVGADSPDQPNGHRLNVPFIAAVLLLIIGLTVPLVAPQNVTDNTSFSTIFWQQREADVIAQIALIFAGVMGVLGLLTGPRHMPATPDHEQEAIQPEPAPDIETLDEPELERV